MKQSREKYISFAPLKMERRDWPDRQLIRAPIWCSVDLRDGNQALMDPMNVEEKLEFFQMLTKIGLKEIEVGFPSASETEREFLRTLIEGNFIPTTSPSRFWYRRGTTSSSRPSRPSTGRKTSFSTFTTTSLRSTGRSSFRRIWTASSGSPQTPPG
jgi:hypothetical protein